MKFIKRFKDIVSGRIAKSNRLIGNHGQRICGKIGDAPSFINALVVGAAMCSIEFLEAILFDVKDFKYNDGTKEANHFKKYIEQLDEKNSFEMFKLVAGNYLARFIGGGFFEKITDAIDAVKITDQFLELYEFSDEDKKIFCDLVQLAKKGGRPSPEFRLFNTILEKVYNIQPPETVFQIMNFELLFMGSFNDIFLPGLLEILKK